MNATKCIKAKMRTRAWVALNGSHKSKRTTAFLGCTPKELREHLERLFRDGMSWENYGLRGWHIDHIVPLSILDLSDPCEVARACHYTNLQPLWARDNIRKSNRKTA